MRAWMDCIYGLSILDVYKRQAYTLLRRGYKGNFKVTAIKDGFVPQSTVSSALKKHQLDADSVVDIILSKIGHGE